MTGEPKLNTRPPTGAVPWPTVLIEGEEKSGKTWAAYLLSASPRVGRTVVLDLGEGSADEYGAIPGVRYEILVHDGSWAQIIGQVEAARAEARRLNDAGDKPLALVVDTMTDEWAGLSAWAHQRAKSRGGNKGRSDEQVTIHQDLWNDSTARHRKFMTLLLTFPGIVVMTSRGKWIADMDDNGKPKEKAPKVYKVEGHKTLAYDASAWIRLTRDAPPLIVGVRSVHHGIRPGIDKAEPIKDAPDNLLDWLIFDQWKCDPRTATVRDLNATKGGDLTAEERGQSLEDGKRAEIRAFAAARKIDLKLLAARFIAEQKADIREADLPQLTAFLSDLQLVAAHEDEKAAA